MGLTPASLSQFLASSSRLPPPSALTGLWFLCLMGMWWGGRWVEAFGQDLEDGSQIEG